MLARLRLAQGRASDAQGMLVQQRSLAESGERTGRLIEILALQAIALDAQGLSTEAEVVLSQAISLALPKGYRRVFLDLGQPLYELLERLAARKGRDEKTRTHISRVMSAISWMPSSRRGR